MASAIEIELGRLYGQAELRYLLQAVPETPQHADEPCASAIAYRPRLSFFAAIAPHRHCVSAKLNWLGD